MYKIFFSMLLCGTFQTGLYAQTSSPVSNVRREISQLDEDVLFIFYDLAPSDRSNSFYQIAMRIRSDTGTTWIKPLGVSGDIGEYIKPGKNKKIVWRFLENELDFVSERLMIDLIPTRQYAATDKRPCTLKSLTPSYLGLGTTVVAGAGIAALGWSAEQKSQKDYKVYAANLNPGDPLYEQRSREDYYQKANNRHRLGTATMVTGGVIVAAGAVYFLRKIGSFRRENRACVEELKLTDLYREKPHWDIVPYSGSYGIGLALRF